MEQGEIYTHGYNDGKAGVLDTRFGQLPINSQAYWTYTIGHFYGAQDRKNRVLAAMSECGHPIDINLVVDEL